AEDTSNQKKEGAGRKKGRSRSRVVYIKTPFFFIFLSTSYFTRLDFYVFWFPI
ncbi:hypothetical protein KSS87_019873, partial [Heliosperma pusillum]